jgi:hypothetical protein
MEKQVARHERDQQNAGDDGAERQAQLPALALRRHGHAPRALKFVDRRQAARSPDYFSMFGLQPLRVVPLNGGDRLAHRRLRRFLALLAHAIDCHVIADSRGVDSLAGLR